MTAETFSCFGEDEVDARRGSELPYWAILAWEGGLGGEDFIPRDLRDESFRCSDAGGDDTNEETP